jgi:hypothetical protein
MNYTEPGSPAASTPSSGSPPPEEFPEESQSKSSSWASTLTNALNPRGLAPGKRRQPPAGSSVGSSARDPKSRRREEGNVRKQSNGPGGAVWGEGKSKDELVDLALVERLRKELGDPFDETVIKQAAK